MNIHELDSYNLGDAVKFHRRLNPRIWGRDEHLLPEVRERLLAIAADFQEFLGVQDLNVKDITISGSNAAYSYTKNSDIDLHLVVEMPDNPVYQELFAAKKYQYNDEHNIKIGGADVELYVQPADQPHHSQGIYSVKNSDWISIPQRKRARIDDACVRDKVADLDARIHDAVRSGNKSKIAALADKIKAMRQAGLEQQGEFGCENLAFKMLRNSGCIKLLWDARRAAQDRELSLREADRPQQRFRYGFSEGHQGQPYSTSDGVAASTKQFLEDSDSETNLVQEFIQHTATELGIDPMPEIHLHSNPEWSTNNHSFGRYDPDSHTLNVSMPNRHILDVLRTVAHELVHCSQNQQYNGLPDDAGETGSRWENDANARAGIIMRDWANSHPEHFELPALGEGASGYIPKNKKEAAMPQYAMALSVDIKPGQVGKEANKLGLKTGRNGEPALLSPSAQNLLREFADFTQEQDNLFEITMSPSSLKKLSAQTGALAGMEFEMIVPGAGDNNDGDQEPDYDFDQRCRSIQDARDFFYDGDFNSRRDVENMSDRMQNDYAEWLYERIDRDFVNESEYLISEWVANNVDESEWNPDDLEGEARQEALDEFISNVDADPSSDYYQQVLDEYREENQDSYDESDWLGAEDLDLMSGVENAYSINWPHWRSTGGGEVSTEDVANQFQAAIGRDVTASSSYHSGRVERPSTKNLQYIVEPDASLAPDDSDDQGLEFVSPPLPIEELLSDLNKVKAWADKTGCYTNNSTGLHINVSVPSWTGGTDQLDYVKLALLLGDEFVLDSFGRAGNTYAKSAMGKIRDAVRKNPDRAQELMDKMKSGMDQLASKVVHSRSTDKYTSINVKDGYIEFRSPGGDWLNDNFKEIDNTLRRFTVALSAAVDPDAYRQEYLKKLYKLLDVSGEKDPLSYFAKFAAGELPRAALKSFVRQAQLERGIKRGKEQPQQEPQGVDTRVDYELYSRASGAVIDTFPARNDDEAQIRLDDYREHGAGQSNPDNFGVRRGPGASAAASTTASHPEGRGRPHDPTGRYAIVARSDQAAYGRTGGPAPNYQFRFNMQNLEDQGHGRYVLQAWAARNSVDPANYIVVDTTQYADAAQGGVIDVAPAQQPAPPPAGGEFTGNWLIRAEDGTVLHRFGGIGNSQADANRTALAWAQRNPDVIRRYNSGLDVVPEMNESLREYRNALATAALAGTMAMGAQAKAPDMVQQIVEPGDTVYSIARQNNVNPLEIYRLNKMDRSTKLEVGQRVVVPDYSKPVGKMPATVAPTVKPPPAAQPAPTLKNKISSMLPKFPDDDEGVTLLSDNPDAEAALQTAAKAAGLKGSELAQFMAQTRHESWDFGKMKEVGNKKTFAKYEKPRLAKQLGNKVRGDGERFKGRGFIQLTGRDNYTRASQQIFGDDRLVKNPDLATRLDVGAQIALWFWKNQVRPAVKDFNNTTQVVKAINADEPAKVVQQRHTKFKEYLAVL
jgi:putative chitinase